MVNFWQKIKAVSQVPNRLWAQIRFWPVRGHKKRNIFFATTSLASDPRSTLFPTRTIGTSWEKMLTHHVCHFLIGIGLEIVNLYLEIFSLLANLLNPHLSKEQWIGIVDAAKKYNNGFLYTMMIMMIMMNMMIKMNMMIWPVNKKKGVARTNWKSPHHRKLIYETWWMCVTHKLTILEEILKWIKWHKMSKCHLVIAWGVQKVDL